MEMKQSEVDSLKPGDLVVFRPKDPEDYKRFKIPYSDSVKGSLLRLTSVREFSTKRFSFYSDDPDAYYGLEGGETDLLSDEWSLEASSQAKKLFDKELEELLNE